MNACIAADRGGPVARGHGQARNWMRGSAPGIAPRRSAGESSPIGGSGAGAAPANAIRKRRRIAIFCIALLLGAGVASTGHGLYIVAKAQLAQVLLHSAWERSRASAVPTRPWPWADTHPVARLVVPARNADLLVLAGASGRTLAFGPGHLDGSAKPGDAGNAVLTAHRDTHFRFLRDVAPGDVVMVERTDGSLHRFRVRDAYVADHRALRLPRDTAQPTLTLVTCYPFDALDPGGPLRYVVVAEAEERAAI